MNALNTACARRPAVPHTMQLPGTVARTCTLPCQQARPRCSQRYTTNRSSYMKHLRPWLQLRRIQTAHSTSMVGQSISHCYALYCLLHV